MVCCGIVGRGACIQSLLFSVLLVLVFPFLSSREFSGLTSHFWCQEWDPIPLVFVVYTLQTQSCNTQVLSMAEKSIDYKSWSLKELRAEARKRFILFTQKDGVKTLASKLKMHDKLMSEKEANTEETAVSEETVDEERAGNLTFDQRLQLLQLKRQIRMEEREAEREKREYER